MYEVIRYFEDLQDNSYPYNVGDTFPRDGFGVSNERLRELSGYENKQHTPLIKKVADSESKSPYTKTEINRMSKESLGILAREVGIENPEEISGNELKKMLIQHFNL